MSKTDTDEDLSDREYLRISQVSKVFPVFCEKTYQRACDRGEIPSTKFGNHRRARRIVKRVDVERWLEGQMPTASVAS